MVDLDLGADRLQKNPSGGCQLANTLVESNFLDCDAFSLLDSRASDSGARLCIGT
jgi:hypothetical protein